MFGKLLKQDIKASFRHNISNYIALGVIFLALAMAALLKMDWLVVIMVIVLMFATFAIFVMTFVVLARAYHEKLFTSQGYLSFTIPVKSSQLVLSKVFVSILWTAINIVALGVAGLVSYSIACALLDGGSAGAFLERVKESGILDLFPTFGAIVQYLGALAFVAICSLIGFWSYIFFSITVANTSKLQAHPKASGLGVFFLITLFSNSLSVAFTQMIPLSIVLSNEKVSIVFENMAQHTDGITSFGLSGAIYNLIIATVLIIATIKVIETKVDIIG